MSKQNEGFNCPSEIPASVPDTRFCSPNKCPRKIPTKRFSSPNTLLSPRELEQLQKFIEETNALLISLSRSEDPQNLIGLKMRFDKLRGILVRVEYECDNNKDNVTGVVKTAGRDFLELEDIGRRYLIPHLRICTVQRNPCEESMFRSHEAHELGDIDQCLRREIVLNFGKVVSESPELINIFFGIPMFLQLVKYVGCKVAVRGIGEEMDFEGELLDSQRDKICVKVNEELKTIDIDKICLVTIGGIEPHEA